MEKITIAFFECSKIWRNVDSREDEGNIEKMRLLSNKLRNVEMVRLCLILYERMDNEKTWYVVQLT